MTYDRLHLIEVDASGLAASPWPLDHHLHVQWFLMLAHVRFDDRLAGLVRHDEQTIAIANHLANRAVDDMQAGDRSWNLNCPNRLSLEHHRLGSFAIDELGQRSRGDQDLIARLAKDTIHHGLIAAGLRRASQLRDRFDLLGGRIDPGQWNDRRRSAHRTDRSIGRHGWIRQSRNIDFGIERLNCIRCGRLIASLHFVELRCLEFRCLKLRCLKLRCFELRCFELRCFELRCFELRCF